MSCESIKNGLDKFANAGLKPLPRSPSERNGRSHGSARTTVLIEQTLFGAPFVLKETPSGTRATVNGFLVQRYIPANEVRDLANFTPLINY